MKIVIKANKKYAERLYKHLRKEHPSTKKRMKLKRWNDWLCVEEGKEKILIWILITAQLKH